MTLAPLVIALTKYKHILVNQATNFKNILVYAYSKLTDADFLLSLYKGISDIKA